jgi:hypothetical protein
VTYIGMRYGNVCDIVGKALGNVCVIVRNALRKCV